MMRYRWVFSWTSLLLLLAALHGGCGSRSFSKAASPASPYREWLRHAHGIPGHFEWEGVWVAKGEGIKKWGLSDEDIEEFRSTFPNATVQVSNEFAIASDGSYAWQINYAVLTKELLGGGRDMFSFLLKGVLALDGSTYLMGLDEVDVILSPVVRMAMESDPEFAAEMEALSSEIKAGISMQSTLVGDDSEVGKWRRRGRDLVLDDGEMELRWFSRIPSMTSTSR